jgi:hypothetical protein
MGSARAARREDEPAILIVGGLDTVYPVGAPVTTHFFRREGDGV